MKLLTAALLRSLPPMRSQEKNPDPTVMAKFFNPGGAGTWYATEYDRQTEEFFGFVEISSGQGELGYFSLRELEGYRSPLGLRIERDMYFPPTKLSKIRGGVGDIEERAELECS